MACTLKELQDAEYEILCAFADFCEKYDIEYVLIDGTLLGAIRHNGFIPWDDDIDIHMDSANFKKFVRKIRKYPIPGFHFSWVGTEPQYPFTFAKLRKNGTYMPEEKNTPLDIHNGVWIDIFTYTGLPKNPKIAKLQKKLFSWYVFLGQIYLNKVKDQRNEKQFEYSRKYNFILNLPFKVNSFIRRCLFSIYTSLGKSNSESVFRIDFMYNQAEPLPRVNFYPICQHAFKDREFNIPANYDQFLTQMYGDYMTPVEFPSHTDLSKIQL